MSNKASKIATEVEKIKKAKELALNTTLPGTIVLTAAVLTGKTYDEAQAYFNEWEQRAKKEKMPNTVFELADAVFTAFDVSKEAKAKVIMLFDEDNVRPPMVSYVIDDEVMPLHYKGYSFGLINDARKAKPNVRIEYLYDEDGEPYKDDENDTEGAD